MLRVLVLAEGRFVTRADLSEQVWGQPVEPGNTTVDVTMGRLRRKLGAQGSALIRNLRGQGYRLVTDPDEEPG